MNKLKALTPHTYSDNLSKWICILPGVQKLYCFENNALSQVYLVSTAKNGLGEKKGSECTPRGWHRIYQIIGKEAPINSIFVGRKLVKSSPASQQVDNILTRILWLDGLEEGFNKGGDVDTRSRYIYIHGTKEPMSHPKPLSHGCIRMRNKDIIALADWVVPDLRVYISPK